MAGYNEIRGLRVKYLSADPSNAEDGQVWYNSTTGNLRVQGIGVGAWSSGSPLSGAVRSAVGSSGTQTASLSVGGESPGYINLVEEYNGSGWTTATNYPLSIQGPLVAGTQTAAVVCGGNTYPPSTDRTETFEYDGSSWTASGALPAGRRALNNTGFGSQTAAVQSGGLIPGGVQNTSNEYNGSIWTAGNTINTNRYVHAGAGTLTAGIISGGVGAAPSYTSLTNVEEYDGTTFTAVNSMSVGRGATAGSNQAPQTSLIVFGGNSTPGSSINNTESYDGTNWTTQSNMALARQQLGGSGSSSSSGLAFAGYSTTQVTSTEEYNFSTSTVTPSVWSSGGTMPSSANQKNGSGILTAAFAVGGETPPGAVVNNTDEYNGTNWTSGGVINSARADVMSGGTLTAGLIMGGFQNVPDPNFLFDETEEYNGSSWSEVNNMPTGGYSGSGTGTQTAAFVNNMYIGSPGERTNVTYEYDGTNWSSGGNTAETTNSRSSVGTLTAGLTVGGRPAPATFISDTELYNGTSWTAGVDMLQPFQAGGQSSKGTQTSCIIFGSPKSPVNTLTYEFDGTSWFTQPNLGTYQNNGTGTATSALAFGVSNTSQEWQAGSTTENPAKNITTS